MGTRFDRAAALAGSVALLAACGGPAESAGGDVGAGGGGAGSASTSAGGAGGAGGCAATTRALAAATEGSCTTVVRIDPATRSLIGHHIFCGAPARADEAAAAATVKANAVFPEWTFGNTPMLLSGPRPADEFVFFVAPIDFGGAGVVSRRNGQLVFVGSVVFDGTGHMLFPTAWSLPAELGPGCGAGAGEPPPARGVSLTNGAPWPTSDVREALGVVWSTALPRALTGSRAPFDALVLFYEPSIIAHPTDDEWLVLVNSGP